MERVTKKYDTSNEIRVPGAVPGVGLMLIRAVLSIKSQFKDCKLVKFDTSL